ncbi:hypothetical protein C0993_011461 [Termitomyces sp. T159_Od127]|nr:hypothetical protein C0993_011461 [Termitomyces sp. T159_Od127]
MLLLHTASATGSSHLLLGTSLTSLSISLISSISQGGGFTVREEAKEDWVPQKMVKTNGHVNGAIRIIRPLQDIGMKECAMWAWWHNLDVVGRDRFPAGKQSIGQLTKDFIVGLERDYPSTVSTIARTCAKLAPKQSTGGTCLLCERPAQYGLQDWKLQTSIRTFKGISSLRPEDSTPSSITPFLCYYCHTTLTSRSSRGTVAVPVSKDGPVPLPLWVTSNWATSTTRSKDVSAQDFLYENDEIWSQKKMDVNQMKATVADFLLELHFRYGTDGKRTWDAYVVAVSGGSGSGKTHVAREIVKSLGFIPTVIILSQDSFYKYHTPEELELAHANKMDFDHPDALDMPMFAKVGHFIHK